MKRYALIFALFFCVLSFKATAQDDVLGEIAEMNDVEVTYVNRNMLQSMSSNNINVGGFNLAKITKELNSLRILIATKGAVKSTRNKMKNVRKNERLEVLMTMKDGDTRTDLWGELASNGNYNKLLLCVDGSKEITIVYMKGNIGQNCFDELTKKQKKVKKAAEPRQSTHFFDLSSLDGLESALQPLSALSVLSSGSEDLTHIDTELKAVNKEIEEYKKQTKLQLDKYDKKIAEYDSKISQYNNKIKATRDNATLNKLYTERNELYNARNTEYSGRNKIFEKLNQLYEKRNKLYAKRGALIGKKLNQDNSSSKKELSMSLENVDVEWIRQVERLGRQNGYRVRNFQVKGVNAELWSASYRMNELRSLINKSIKENVNTTELQKFLDMWEEIYDRISDKIVAEANKDTAKGSKSKKSSTIYVFDKNGNFLFDAVSSEADLWYNVEASFGSLDEAKTYLKNNPGFYNRYVLKCDDNRYRSYYNSGSYDETKSNYSVTVWQYFYGDEK